MSTMAAPESRTRTDEADPCAGWLRHRLAAGLASGLLCWTTFPPMEWGWLAWVALAPLFWLATVQGATGRTYLAAWTGGLVFWLLAVPWLRLIGPGAWIGWVVLAAVFSLWWPLFLAIARWARWRLGAPLMIAAPISWVAVEYLRAYFLTGFPWYYAAHSQYRNLYVIQISDVTGSLGVSFLIAIVNAWLVDLVTTPIWRPAPGARRQMTPGHMARLWAVTILVGATLGYGVYRIRTADFRPGPRVALLQSVLKQKDKFRRDPFQVQARFHALIRSAMSHEPRPDLVVWPETSYPFSPFVLADAKMDRAVLSEQVKEASEGKMTLDAWLYKAEAVVRDLHAMADEYGVPMLVGCGFWEHRLDRIHKFNAALYFRPSSPAYEFYHKMHLVPFGEFIPFIDVLPILAALTPYRDKIPNLDRGDEPRTFQVGPYRVAPLICFEDTISRVVGRFFRDGEPPDLIVTLSNDGWYPNSPELDAHLAVGVFRAIEHRVPMARAVNTGFSGLVDGNGEIVARLPKDVEQELTVDVPLDDRTTWYSQWGDWLGFSCLAVTIGWLPLGLIRPRRDLAG